jgi:hypothetical protein
MAIVNHLLHQVPGWLQGFCVAIIIVFAYFLIVMLGELRALLKARAGLLTLFGSVPAPDHDARRNGLSLEHLDRLRQTCSSLDSVERRWWNRIEPNIQPYASPGGREGWFAVAPFQEVLSEQDLEVGYHGGLYQSVPGVLTGLGLLGTFTALLIGLLDLRYTPAEIVGLNTLINNLSGKFLSSVVALVLSLLFLLIERIACERSLARTYEQVAAKFEELLPRLSSTQVLIDIQKLQVQQATSLGNISSDFVDRFVGVFKADLSPVLAAGVSHEMARELQTEFRPMLGQMSEVLVQVKDTIQRLESNKQESVVGELHGLIEALQKSITSALSEMGSQFHQQLTGAAQNEFDNVQDTLSGTARMLQDMNVQFQSMQVALGQVIEEAKRSTDTQLSSGREQVEALTRLMEGLMLRLNDSADTSLKNVSATLTVVVDDLSQKVSAVSSKMLEAVSNSTSRSQEAASQVFQTAGAWSEATAKRLEALVGSIELRSNDVNAAGVTLLRANEAIKNTLLQNQNALDSLSKASEQVRLYSSSLAGLAKNADEIQKGQILATTQVKQVVEEFRRVSTANSGFLDEYKKVFTEYRGVFEGVDSRIAATLTAINQGMNAYVQAVENNFRTIVTVTNQHLPQISTTLKDQITELEGQLEELSDVFDKGLKGLRSEAARKG